MSSQKIYFLPFILLLLCVPTVFAQFKSGGIIDDRVILNIPFNNTIENFATKDLPEYFEYNKSTPTTDWIDLPNFFDNDSSTYAFYSPSTSLGLSFEVFLGWEGNFNRTINGLNISARWVSAGATTGNNVAIELQSFDGTTWNSEATLVSSSSNSGWDILYNSTYSLNKNVSGVRLRYHGTQSVGGFNNNDDLYVYDLGGLQFGKLNSSFNQTATYSTGSDGDINGALEFNGINTSLNITPVNSEYVNAVSFWYQLPNGTWYHYVNNSGVYYINNENVSDSSAPYFYNEGLFFGRNNTASYFNGSIDNIFVFNESLTEEEIQILYQLGQENSFVKEIFLINEQDNAPPNLDNFTTAILYYDDNSTLFDFKQENTTEVTFYGTVDNSKLRLELEYSNSDLITRYVDTAIQDDLELRICANEEGPTHYEQLIISSSEKAVKLNNVFSNCVVALDYTRFVYQDSLMLRAYTIQAPYSLLKFNTSGSAVVLAGLDGGTATFYNIDVLEFNAEGFSLNIFTDALAFNHSGNTTQIYFSNPQEDSVSTNIVIERINTSAIMLNQTITSTPNNFTIFFDYTTLNVSPMELFSIDVTLTDAEGNTRNVLRYFNTNGGSGVIQSPFAFVIGFLLLVFGLTLASSRLVIGWFGMVVVIMSIGFLSFSPMTWYIMMLIGMDIIILIYIILQMMITNPSNLAGAS